ncbi:MAG: oligosaccharide flippase family protein, partial [Candidatus Pacearchaeota archaeon]
FFIYPKIKRYPREILEKEEKKEVYKFILPLGVTSLSLVFFGNVDIMMLGKFVESSYIGFYQIAISVLSSIIAFIPFAAAFFPLFSRLPKEKLDLALKKAVFFTIAVSIIVFIFSFVFSEIAIKIIFGENYLFSSTLIKIFCVLVIIDPLNAVLSNFYISQNKSNFLAKCLIFSLILNIILNYLFISSFLKISMYYATIGASLATIISRSFYLLLLVKNRKNI